MPSFRETKNRYSVWAGATTASKASAPGLAIGPGGKPAFEVLNPETFDYEPQQQAAFPALAEVAKIRDLGERLQALFDSMGGLDAVLEDTMVFVMGENGSPPPAPSLALPKSYSPTNRLQISIPITRRASSMPWTTTQIIRGQHSLS